MLMHKNSDHFNLHDCSFIVQKCKESTARVVMWREFGLINSFTLECSFCGPTGGVYMDCHFTPSILLVRNKLVGVLPSFYNRILGHGKEILYLFA